MFRHSLIFIVLLGIAAIAAILLLLRPGSSESGSDGAGAERAPGRVAPLFSADSVWNEPLPAEAKLDPSSERLVSGLVREVEREEGVGNGPWITASTCSTPIYIVPSRQRTVRVRLSKPREAWRAGLARVFRRVPLPAGAEPGDCSDAHLTVWQPSRDRLWEFFKLRRGDRGWEADWGGALRRVSRSPGFYSARSWPGRSNFSWGATATSLPVAAGVMRLAELRRGRIDHALAMNVPAAQAGVFSWPAQRGDGVGSSADVPEGARLRIDPSLDLASLELPPLTSMIARAAQRYGIIVRDQTGPGNAISFFGETATSGAKPYSEAGGFYEGMAPDELLADFPWEHLQVLKMSLCRSGPCTR